MKIIILEPNPSSTRGGMERSLLEVTHGLAARGHEIVLLHESDGDLIDQYSSFCVETAKVGQLRFARGRLLPALQSFLKDSSQIAIDRRSLVYCNRPQDTLFAALLRALKGVKVACHLRMPAPDTVGKRLGLGLRYVNRCIAISEQTRRSWIQTGAVRCELDLVYNGIDVATFERSASKESCRQLLNLPCSGYLICYVGRLDDVKGVDVLIRAFAIFRKHFQEAHLAIAGKHLVSRNKYVAGLRELTLQLGLKNSVSFLGHIANPRTLYQASDICAVPSRWPEPLARTILESMACGTPVVASDVGGSPEVLTADFATGLFPSEDERALFDSLVRTIQETKARRNNSELCRNHIVQKFSIQRNIAQIEASLQKALSS